MKRSIVTAAVVILSLYGISIKAQQAKTSSGTYTTYVGGQLFGFEDYTLTTNADGSTQSQSAGAFGPSKFKTITKAERMKPVSFVVTTDSGTLQAEFTSEVVVNPADKTR